MNTPVEVNQVGKRFKRYQPGRPRKLENFLFQGPSWIRPVTDFWALREVSFSLGGGQMVGLIGRNSSGKSTLLRIIADIIRPDEGWVRTKGRIGALLNLGANFHPDLTGRENVYISSIIGGLDKQETSKRFDSIVAFAEVEDFIDNPLKTYSTGMQMRLAFSIAVHSDFDILLVDEVLSVGDAAFQLRCLNCIEQIKSAGVSILFVSHDTGQIKNFCDEAIWLRHGVIAAIGDPDGVVRQYFDDMSHETKRRSRDKKTLSISNERPDLKLDVNRFGSLELEIAGVQLFDNSGQAVTGIECGESLHIAIEYMPHMDIVEPIFGVDIIRDDKRVCCNMNTAADGQMIPKISGPGKIFLHFDRLDLHGGRYFINVGIYEKNWTYTYDYHKNVYPLTISQTPGDKRGVLYPPHDWEVFTV